MLAGRQNHNWNLNNCPVLSGVGEEVARPPSPEGYTRSSVCSSTASPSDWLLGMLSNAFLLKNHHFLPMSARQLISVISTLTADTHSCRHWGDKDHLEGLVSISITWKHLGKHIFDCRLYLLHSHRSIEIADFGFPFEESFLQVLNSHQEVNHESILFQPLIKWVYIFTILSYLYWQKVRVIIYFFLKRY